MVNSGASSSHILTSAIRSPRVETMYVFSVAGSSFSVTLIFPLASGVLSLCKVTENVPVKVLVPVNVNSVVCATPATALVKKSPFANSSG